MSAHDEQQAKILDEMAVQIQCAVEMVGPRDYVPTVEELAREMAPQLATVAALQAGAAALRRASKDQSVEIALLKAENAELRGKIAEREQC